MRQDAIDEFAGNLVGGVGLEVERGDDREDRRAGFGSERHVAQMNAVERRLAHAEDQRPAFLQANVGGALDELDGHAVGDARQRSHAAGQDDHGVGWVRAAGHVGADVGVVLLLDFVRRAAQQLGDNIVAAGDAELFGHHAQAAVGEDEVDGPDPLVPFERVEQMLGKDRTAGAGDGDGQDSRSWVGR